MSGISLLSVLNSDYVKGIYFQGKNNETNEKSTRK